MGHVRDGVHHQAADFHLDFHRVLRSSFYHSATAAQEPSHSNGACFANQAIWRRAGHPHLDAAPSKSACVEENSRRDGRELAAPLIFLA